MHSRTKKMLSTQYRNPLRFCQPILVQDNHHFTRFFSVFVRGLFGIRSVFHWERPNMVRTMSEQTPNKHRISGCERLIFKSLCLLPVSLVFSGHSLLPVYESHTRIQFILQSSI